MTHRHWTAGSKLPPADYAPHDPEDLFPLQMIRRSDLESDDAVRARVRGVVSDMEHEREEAAERLARGAAILIGTAVFIGMLLGAMITWLAMR